METLIRLVRPSILRKIVIPYANFKHVKLRIKIDHRIKFAKYLDFLESELNRPGKSGYAQLVRDYTAVDKLSKQYLQWFNPKLHTELL